MPRKSCSANNAARFCDAAKAYLTCFESHLKYTFAQRSEDTCRFHQDPIEKVIRVTVNHACGRWDVDTSECFANSAENGVFIQATHTMVANESGNQLRKETFLERLYAKPQALSLI